MTTWEHIIFPSGTQIVDRRPTVAGVPLYYVGPVAGDNAGESLRSQIAEELARWLNGGDAPSWLDSLRRENPDTVKTQDGASIRATGPMVDIAVPPAWGLWTEDKSETAQGAREQMATALITKIRPK